MACPSCARRAAALEVECVLCPVGSRCGEAGAPLASLPLLPGYYRTSNASDDLRRCPDFGPDAGCVGGVGVGEGPCGAQLRGPYCRLCNVTDTSRYYDASGSACVPCEGDVAALGRTRDAGAITALMVACRAKQRTAGEALRPPGRQHAASFALVR